MKAGYLIIPSNWGGDAQCPVQNWRGQGPTSPVLSATTAPRILFRAGPAAQRGGAGARGRAERHNTVARGPALDVACAMFFVFQKLS